MITRHNEYIIHKSRPCSFPDSRSVFRSIYGSRETPSRPCDQTQITPSSTKSDIDILRENEEIFQFCPPEKKNMTKILDGLPPFKFNFIVNYVSICSVKTSNSRPTTCSRSPLSVVSTFSLEGIFIMFLLSIT